MPGWTGAIPSPRETGASPVRQAQARRRPATLAGVIERRGENFRLPGSRPQVGQSPGRSWAAIGPVSKAIAIASERPNPRTTSANPDHHLPQVGPTEETEKGGRHPLEAVDHGLGPLHLAGLDPPGHLPDEIGLPVIVIEDDEPADR